MFSTGYSSFTVDRNTKTVIWVTDGYNSSLVTFSLGIFSSNIHFYWTSNHFPLSLPVGFCFVLFMDSVITPPVWGGGGYFRNFLVGMWTLEPLTYTWVTGKYEPRGERDVIRFRNPTEDKRDFRRMLTSANPPAGSSPGTCCSKDRYRPFSSIDFRKI